MNRAATKVASRTFVSPAVVLALVAAAALALRLWGLGGLGDLDFDEQASFFISSKPVGEMLRYLAGAPFEHPPLFYLLFRAWLGIAGESETAMRLFSVALGTLTVPLVGATVWRVAGASAGTVAALALTLSPLHVFYSRDARMYALLALFMALAMAGVGWVEQRNSGERRSGSAPTLGAPVSRTRSASGGPGRAGCPCSGIALLRRLRKNLRITRLTLCWALGLAAGLGALATHYYALFSVAGFAAGLATTQPASREARRTIVKPGWWLAAAIAGIALAAFLWFFAAPGLRTSLSVAQPRLVDVGQLLGAVAKSIGAPLAGPLAPEAWAIGAAGLVAAVLVASRLAPTDLPLTRLHAVAWWGFLATSLAIPLLLVLGRSFAPRFVALGVPFLAVLLGLAARRLDGRPLLLGGAVYGAAALVGLVPIYDGYVRSDYGQALAHLRAEARPDDAIVLNGPWQDLLYQRYGWGLPPRFIIASTVPLDAPEAVGWLERLTAAHPRLWVVDSATDAADPEGVVAGWLDAHAYPRPVVEYRKALLRPYLTDHGPALEARPTDLAALDLRLDSIALEHWTLRPGDEVRLRIEGQLAALDGAALKGGPGDRGGPPFRAAAGGAAQRRLVAVLAGPDGASVWHWDGALHLGEERWVYRAALVVPREALPGPYQLRLAVYEPAVDVRGYRVIGRMSEVQTATVEVRSR